MLRNLHVQNFAIIDQIDIDFKNGLTVLTGETGAGKSLIIDAINLLTGGKTSPNVVRNGAVKAVIEGVFDNFSTDTAKFLNDLEIENDDELIIRRDIYATGKTTYRVNGITVTASQIELLCENLVDIHVQNDTLRLFNPKNYLSFIDDNDSLNIIANYQECYKRYLEVLKEYKELIKNKDQSDQNLDYIKFQLNEIEQANLKIGEEDELLKELKVLDNYENIFQAFQNIKLILNNDNISENLYEIMDNLKKLKLIKPSYLEYYSNIENAYFILEELNNTIKSDMGNLEYDEDRVNEINDRLSTISRLKRKYRLDVDGILSLKEELIKQIDNVDNFEFFEKELNIKLQNAYNNLKEVSIKLTNKRLDNANNLKNNILSTLKDLMLDKVRLEFVFNEVEYNDFLNSSIFTKNGVDTCDILISFNMGETLKPLSKVASGGEMSRVMLALKTHLFKNKQLSTVIFDEIDTGMSGVVAEGVAKKLKLMSSSMQVFSITHLPIVASIADNHLFVKKSIIDDKTSTDVVELSFNERVNEIAEMIAPNDTTGKAKEVAALMLNKK
jgi:DNA repair protein RecN (Recombination protein N)